MFDNYNLSHFWPQQFNHSDLLGRWSEKLYSHLANPTILTHITENSQVMENISLYIWKIWNSIGKTFNNHQLFKFLRYFNRSTCRFFLEKLGFVIILPVLHTTCQAVFFLSRELARLDCINCFFKLALYIFEKVKIIEDFSNILASLNRSETFWYQKFAFGKNFL